MPRKPLILVVPSTHRRGVEFSDLSISLSDCYTRAIIAGGGIPLVMPCNSQREFIAECVSRCDGILLTGGDDVHLRHYCKKNLPLKLKKTVTGVDELRDELELRLIEQVFASRKPLLAICRGLQVLNVALGGTLIVDIPQQVPGALEHRRSDRKNDPVHEIIVTPDSLMARVVGPEDLPVNSSHHQAAGQVAPSLRVTARSADGVVEALELNPARAKKQWLLAVQFHPERMCERHPRLLKIFKAFAAASGRNR